MGTPDENAEQYEKVAPHGNFLANNFAKRYLSKRLMEMSPDQFNQWFEKTLRDNPESVEFVLSEKEWERRLIVSQIQATIETTAKQIEATIKSADAQASATIKAAQQQSDATIQGAQRQVEAAVNASKDQVAALISSAKLAAWSAVFGAVVGAVLLYILSHLK